MLFSCIIIYGEQMGKTPKTGCLEFSGFRPTVQHGREEGDAADSFKAFQTQRLVRGLFHQKLYACGIYYEYEKPN